MLTTKNQLVLSLLISTSSFTTLYPFSTYSFFDEMIEEINEMRAHFEKRKQYFEQEFNKAKSQEVEYSIEQPTIYISENKNAATIDVSICPLNIKEKIFDANMDQENNTLTISSSSGNIGVKINRSLLIADFSHSLKQENDPKNNKASFCMNSFNQSVKNIAGEVSLEESTIEYDQTSKKLVISIPLRKKLLTKIPITVKTGTAKEEK